jgi:hypothetical protein
LDKVPPVVISSVPSSKFSFSFTKRGPPSASAGGLYEYLSRHVEIELFVIFPENVLNVESSIVIVSKKIPKHPSNAAISDFQQFEPAHFRINHEAICKPILFILRTSNILKDHIASLTASGSIFCDEFWVE